jgi:UDP-GlcNAc:undecaprenyl-phosphate GlcNAc-1-phosphate transferase
MNSSIYAFTAALVASVSLTPAVRQLAFRTGMVDKPNARKIHHTPIPLLGGLAIAFGAILATLVFVEGGPTNQMLAILCGQAILLAVGTADDRGMLHHQTKLMVAMPLVALLVIVADVRLTVLENLFNGVAPVALLAVADYTITFIWLVGITAAFSILDHMDGLCAGTAVIGALFFIIFSITAGQTHVATLAAATLGAALGFLRWNFNPAKIFMGDGGAMFLGFTMAVLGLKIRPAGVPDATAWIIPVLILIVPIFDTFMVSISRARRSLIPFSSPGKDHTAHRLSNLSLGHRNAVLCVYLVGLAGGMLALLVSQLDVIPVIVLAIVLVAVAVSGVVLLERAPFERQQKKTPGDH